jgi:trimeric autotransporter adhesin
MPSRATAVALLALFAALAGTATAAKLIDGKTIRRGTVTGRQVQDRSLGTNELSRGAIASLRRNLTRVTGAQIADGTVALADMAPSSVGGTQVVDRSLTGGDLVTDTLTQTELGVGSVADSELADLSVGNEELKNNSISNNKIRASAIRTGTATATFGAIASGACETQTAAGYTLPTGALTGTVIEVEPPAGLGNGFVTDGRSDDGNTLQIQVCNFTGSAQSPSGTFRFVAFGS